MKALRARMSKNLKISVGKNAKVSPDTMFEEKKSIRDMSEKEFKELYRLKGEVMESTNRGMQVLFAVRLSDGMEVVIKTRDRAVSFKLERDEKEWRNTTEVQLNMPPTDTICQLIDVVATEKNYYVVMEKVDGKDLFEQMQDEHLSQADAREVVYQILEGLKALHDAGRIHKDLKLENVMVDMNADKEPTSPGGKMSPSASRKSANWASASPMTKTASLRSRSSTRSNVDEPQSPTSPGVKLIDFDTVTEWEPTSPKAADVLGTDGYIAPEAYLGDYSPASDIYCVGVIMYRLITRTFPSRSELFDDGPGENWVGSPAMLRIHARLKEEKMDFNRRPLNRYREAADLVSKLLKFEPSERLSATEALAHNWFKMTAEELERPATTVEAKTRRPSASSSEK